MPIDAYLPTHISAADVAARLALVSDTHMPERLAALPPALFSALDGADLLLHAGDVGKLWVLERLSAVAPVVAVHGNDDTAESQTTLPYSTVAVAAGVRIFLWHSHHPDPAQELAGRNEEFAAKLARTAGQARRAGARVAVFGHWHIPLARWVDGVLVVNPGAIAPAQETTRLVTQSCAALFVLKSGEVHAAHVDLANPEAVYRPLTNFDEGFTPNAARYSVSILDAELAARLPAARAALSAALAAELRRIVIRLAHPIWAGSPALLSTADLLEAIESDGMLATEERSTLLAAIGSSENPILSAARRASGG